MLLYSAVSPYSALQCFSLLLSAAPCFPRRSSVNRRVLLRQATWAPPPAAPSAALLRAVLLNGAAPLGGTRGSDGPPLPAPPAVEVGYGRVDLARALGIPGSGGGGAPAGARLALLDGQTQPESSATARAVLKQGGAARHCVRVAGGGALRATLAWTDPAAEPYARLVRAAPPPPPLRYNSHARVSPAPYKSDAHLSPAPYKSDAHLSLSPAPPVGCLCGRGHGIPPLSRSRGWLISPRVN
jgi:hypothetical protein